MSHFNQIPTFTDTSSIVQANQYRSQFPFTPVLVNSVTHFAGATVVGRQVFSDGVEFITSAHGVESKHFLPCYVKFIYDITTSAAENCNISVPETTEGGWSVESNTPIEPVRPKAMQVACATQNNGLKRPVNTSWKPKTSGQLSRSSAIVSSLQSQKLLDGGTSSGKVMSAVLKLLVEDDNVMASGTAKLVLECTNEWRLLSKDCSFDDYLELYLRSDNELVHGMKQCFVSPDVMKTFCLAVHSVLEMASGCGHAFGELLYVVSDVECSTKSRIVIEKAVRKAEAEVLTSTVTALSTQLKTTLHALTSNVNCIKQLKDLESSAKNEIHLTHENSAITAMVFRLVMRLRMYCAQKGGIACQIDKCHYWSSAVYGMSRCTTESQFLSDLIPICYAYSRLIGEGLSVEELTAESERITNSAGDDSPVKIVVNYLTGAVTINEYMGAIDGKLFKAYVSKFGKAKSAGMLVRSALSGMAVSQFRIPIEIVEYIRESGTMVEGFSPLVTFSDDVLARHLFEEDGVEITTESDYTLVNGTVIDDDGDTTISLVLVDKDQPGCLTYVGVDGHVSSDFGLWVEACENIPIVINRFAPTVEPKHATGVVHVHTAEDSEMIRQCNMGWLKNMPCLSDATSGILHTLVHWEFPASRLIVLFLGPKIQSVEFTDQIHLQSGGMTTLATLLKKSAQCVILQSHAILPRSETVTLRCVRFGKGTKSGVMREEIALGQQIVMEAGDHVHSKDMHIVGEESVGLTVRSMIRNWNLSELSISVKTGSVSIHVRGQHRPIELKGICSDRCSAHQ